MDSVAVQFRYDDFLAANWLVFRKRHLLKGLIRIIFTWSVISAVLVMLLTQQNSESGLGVGLIARVATLPVIGALSGWLICVWWKLPGAARVSVLPKDQIDAPVISQFRSALIAAGVSDR
jgi:hypothetical protein